MASGGSRSDRGSRLSWRDDPGPPAGSGFTAAFTKGRYKNRPPSTGTAPDSPTSAGSAPGSGAQSGAAVGPGVGAAQSGAAVAAGGGSGIDRRDGERLAALMDMPKAREPEEGQPGEQGFGKVIRIKERFGFINSADFNDNLFFHFNNVAPEIVSQLHEDMPVAYTLQRDRRSQRITAINLEPVSEAAVSDEFFPGQELLGMVSRKPTLWPRDRDPQLSNCGKIDFKYDGQLFHASFYNEDVVPDTVPLGEQDIVAFYLAIDRRTFLPRAFNIALREKAPETAVLRGIISSVKPGKFGFIEREDVADQTFFNTRTSWTGPGEPTLGTEVVYELAEHRGKPVAVNMVPLPKGSVVLYDVFGPEMRGVVLDLSRTGGPPAELFAVAGQLSCLDAPEGSPALPFRASDMSDYPPIRIGDVVTFQQAVDRRNGAIIAVNVRFCHKATRGKAEGQRETGFIAVVKDGFGFIRCAERDARVFFHFSQIPSEHRVQPGDEVSFLVEDNAGQGQGGREPRGGEALKALDLELLPPGSIVGGDLFKGDCVGIVRRPITDYSQKRVRGRVDRSGEGAGMLEVRLIVSPEESGAPPASVIGSQVPFVPSDLRTTMALQTGDEVRFTLARVKASEEPCAVGIELVNANDDGERRSVGPISDLKESFGFIEAPTAKAEIFFHFSELQGFSSQDLSPGDFVSYVIITREGKRVAARIKQVDEEDIDVVEVLEPGVYKGRVTRPLKAPGRNYGGRVEITEMPRDAPAPDTPTVEVKHHAAAATAPLDTGDFPSLGTGGGGASGAAAGGEGSAAWAQRHQEAQAASGSVEAALQEVPEGSATKSAAGGKAGTLQVGKTVPFGVRGMLDKKERLKVGDVVRMRIATDLEGNSAKATRIELVEREASVTATAPVETVKDGFGFISYVPEGTREMNLFFHLSNVVDDSTPAPGDVVSFELGRNPKSQKFQALNVKMIRKRPTQRPQTLRPRTNATGPVPGIIRQPTLPEEKQRGFALGRGREPGTYGPPPAVVGGLAEADDVA